jgi:endoglucanase
MASSVLRGKTDHSSEHFEVLRSLLNVETAPFHERAVVEQVRLWAKSRGVKFQLDAAGNVVLRQRRDGAGAHWVFAAHMDHPGFVVRAATAGRIVHAEFLGNVKPEFFPGARVRFFSSHGSVQARVIAVRRSKRSPFLQCRLEMVKPAQLAAGTIGMWDLPPLRVAGRKLSSRGCDDVVGSAAVLCAMEDIVAGKFPCDVTGLLTRAEEVGFIGALAACEHGTIPRDSLIVAIETSKAQPAGPLGSGVVVRVGDSIRTFDPSLTAHVTAAAGALARRKNHFRYTRQLMPGGATESSAYLMMGYRATGLCLPLGNYHNQGPRGRIASERVDLDDFESLVKLLVALAADKGSLEQTDEELRRRLRDLTRTRGGYL